MTASGGGPAAHGAGDRPAGDGRDRGEGDRDEGVRGAGAAPPRSAAPRVRTVLALARVEASLQARSLPVLAGLLAGTVVVWLRIQAEQPLWWHAGWETGGGQLILGMAVLAAAQLAAGRAQRNAMADLYGSFPVTAGARTLAHLAALAGVVPASLLLAGAAAGVVQIRGAIGAPDLAVLGGGVLLVVAAGAAGTAIGTRFGHPLAGVIGALALFVSSATTHLATGGGVWLLPWNILQDQLGWLPGPLAGYPPASAHAAELAGAAALAGIVALAVTASRARARGGLAAAGVVAVAVICAAGALQLRPVPTAALSRLVAETADPGSVQRCTTANRVRYCLYPGFGRDLPALEAPVNGVLAHLPARPGQPLTVRQVLSLDFTDSTLTHGHPQRQVSRWNAQARRAPGTAASASAIYLPVGSWPAAGGRLADARFAVALRTAEWAVHLPPTRGNLYSRKFLPCVPYGQARESVAIWLAILATHPPAGELRDSASGAQSLGVAVRGTMVRAWSYPGENDNYLTPGGGGPQLTAAGYLLADAMTRLPEQKVALVLTGAWDTWLNWRTTGAQLAAALGIRMPSVPALLGPAPGIGISQAPRAPQNPVCTR